MPKFVRCGHYGEEERCPCIDCDSTICAGCYEAEEGLQPYAVNTDDLCEKAREYCLRGRTGIDAEIYTGGAGG